MSVERDTLGPSPTRHDIDRILRRAAECEVNFHAESTWNAEVHHELPRVALRPGSDDEFAQPVNFTLWYVNAKWDFVCANLPLM